MSYSEHSEYYEGCERGSFAHEDAEQCGCSGTGWFLSQLDTWHECPVHFAGQVHPENYEPDEAPVETPVAAKEPEGANGDDIPF